MIFVHDCARFLVIIFMFVHVFLFFYLFVFYINTPGESLGFVIVNVCLCFFCTGIRHVNIVFIFVYKFSV